MQRLFIVTTLAAACAASCKGQGKPPADAPATVTSVGTPVAPGASVAAPVPASQPATNRAELTREEGDALLALARQSFESKVRNNREISVPPDVLAKFPRLATRGGAFVTLREKGELRGCIGTLEAHRPLAEDVIKNAVSAAIEDPRFSPVTADEIKDIEVSISVLDAPRPLAPLAPDGLLDLFGKTHPGVVLTYHGRRSTFLPEVWDELPDAAEFLGHLCRKQGAPTACFRDSSTRFETYGSQHFAEAKR
jgi:AmmeMemoRadiSam system protein A